ncbi:MAG: helix-turn-helix domain-containing protein [Kiritimatiellales bacterium]|nr:helix-turn-helix domain-containing protein [Kiritimatiellales bacterium]
MATIGQQFKAAREAKGASESEAATATKILTKIIVAMEADDFSVMAAPTYAKGFIRLYAEYLGLDPDPLVAEYTEKHAGGPRRLIDESSQLEQNTQDSRIFPNHTKRSSTKAGNPFARLAPLGGLLSGGIKKVPLGPLKDIRVAAGVIAGLLVLAALISSVSTCVHKHATEKPKAPAIAPARMLLEEPLPDLYLTEPEKIETN